MIRCSASATRASALTWSRSSAAVRAVEKLAEAGFSRVYNQHEGFEGDLSPEGRRSVNGWRNAGLPWTFKPDKAKFYLRG